LPDYTAEAPEDITAGLNAQLANPPYPGFQDSLKLDAPLAVQAQARPGFFPLGDPTPDPAIPPATPVILPIRRMPKYLLGISIGSRCRAMS